MWFFTIFIYNPNFLGREIPYILPGLKDPRLAKKGVKKKTGVTPLVGLMDPYTSEERSFFKCYRLQRTHVWRIRGK